MAHRLQTPRHRDLGIRLTFNPKAWCLSCCRFCRPTQVSLDPSAERPFDKRETETINVHPIPNPEQKSRARHRTRSRPRSPISLGFLRELPQLANRADLLRYRRRHHRFPKNFKIPASRLSVKPSNSNLRLHVRRPNYRATPPDASALDCCSRQASIPGNIRSMYLIRIETVGWSASPSRDVRADCCANSRASPNWACYPRHPSGRLGIHLAPRWRARPTGLDLSPSVPWARIPGRPIGRRTEMLLPCATRCLPRPRKTSAWGILKRSGDYPSRCV